MRGLMNTHLETKVGPTTGALKRVFSGIQPSGAVHLGNYLGAIKGWIDRQEQKENFFCIVDLHAITSKQDPKILKANIRETTATFLASGIDFKKSIIFNQSLVPAHSEGSWILGCIARMGWLNRMTQFKEKAGKDKEKASVGLYIYPVLMRLIFYYMTRLMSQLAKIKSSI